MKDIFHNLKNKAFDNQVRLSLMSMLVVNDSVDFSTFKEMLELSDGNLSSHLSFLETENMLVSTSNLSVSVRNQFTPRLKWKKKHFRII